MRNVVAVFIVLMLGCGAAWAAPAALVTEVVSIEHAEVAPLVPLCKALFPSLGYEAGTAGIMVTGSRSDIEAVRQFVATMDVPPRPVLLDVHVVALSDEAYLAHTCYASTGGCDPSRLKGARDIAGRYVVARPFHEVTVFIGDHTPVAYFDSQECQLQLRPVDIGVGMSIIPHLTIDGFITLSITHHVSTLRSVAGVAPPTMHETWNKTHARLRDGDSIVLDNLLNEWNQARSGDARPFLEEVQVLGEVFRSQPRRLIVTIKATTVAP